MNSTRQTFVSVGLKVGSFDIYTSRDKRSMVDKSQKIIFGDLESQKKFQFNHWPFISGCISSFGLPTPNFARSSYMHHPPFNTVLLVHPLATRHKRIPAFKRVSPSGTCQHARNYRTLASNLTFSMCPAVRHRIFLELECMPEKFAAKNSCHKINTLISFDCFLYTVGMQACATELDFRHARGLHDSM